MKNRIYPKLEQHVANEDENPSLNVKALLLSSCYKAPKDPSGDALFASKHQGRDFPGALRLLTAPYAENDLSLTHVRFRIIGCERMHYEAELIASGPPGLVCKVAAEVVGSPIVYNFVQKVPAIKTVPVEHPFIADIRTTFSVDQAGLVHYLSALTGTVYQDGLPVWTRGSAVCQTASLVEVAADVLNDVGLPEGGTPGFQIKAQVAAPTKQVLEAVLENWSLFCCGNDALQSIFSRQNIAHRAGCELQIRDLGNTRTLPTQFLVAV